MIYINCIDINSKISPLLVFLFLSYIPPTHTNAFPLLFSHAVTPLSILSSQFQDFKVSLNLYLKKNEERERENKPIVQ